MLTKTDRIKKKDIDTCMEAIKYEIEMINSWKSTEIKEVERDKKWQKLDSSECSWEAKRGGRNNFLVIVKRTNIRGANFIDHFTIVSLAV